MKAGELKKLLADVPDDTLVVMSRDSEGNGYSPLFGTKQAFCKQEDGWCEEPHKEKRPDDQPCFVLWPYG